LNVLPGSSEAIAGAGPSDVSLRIEMKQLQQAAGSRANFVHWTYNSDK